MSRTKYTEEQKAAVVARASEIGFTAAAKEAGIDRSTVTRWSKAAADAKKEETAEEPAAKKGQEEEKNTAEPSSVIEEKIEEAEEKAEEAEAVYETKVGDAVAALEIEAKKAFGKAKRAVKDTTAMLKVKAEKSMKKARAAKVDLIFESNSGQQITLESLGEIIPKGAETAYIKFEENKIYWVKGEETGSVDIW